jgi:hypothetical protein
MIFIGKSKENKSFVVQIMKLDGNSMKNVSCCDYECNWNFFLFV